MLIITITDGAPDDRNDVFVALGKAKTYNDSAGGQLLAFEFAQVGNDRGATDFLSALDAHAVFGKIVDATSAYEIEEAQYAKQGASLSASMWLMKLMLGAIDPDYDMGDEGTA